MTHRNRIVLTFLYSMTCDFTAPIRASRCYVSGTSSTLGDGGAGRSRSHWLACALACATAR
jgi:hypothetical protein